MKIPGADFLPVVQRELREGARRPFNYWLRVGGAAAGGMLLYSVHQSAIGDQAIEGLQLFISLHVMLLGLICVLVPAMGADCVAREKREGTLGLLFLTPLTGMGVAVGKGLVQAFRAFTLWLAVLPVLLIPFLMGGVAGGDVCSALTLEFCVTLLCLAAGMLASSLAKARSAAFFLAASFGVAFVCLFGVLLGLGFFWQTRGPSQPANLTQLAGMGESLITGQSGGNMVFGPAPAAGFTGLIGSPYYSTSPSQARFVGISPNGSQMLVVRLRAPYLVSAGWSPYFAAPATRGVWRSLLLESGLMVPLLCCLVLRFAARRMEFCWQDKPPSLLREGWIKVYCVPLARRRFARQMRRTLEWNPVAWLQQYSWKARASKWGLCLVFVLLECAATLGGPSDILNTQYLLLAILGAAMTYAGVNSFLTEKKSGALELLLVTPVSPNQIIFGRVWGLWKQFLPAALTLLLCWRAAESLVSIFGGNPWRFTPPQWQFDVNSTIIWRLLIWPLAAGLRRGAPWHPFNYDRSLNLVGSAGFRIFLAAVAFFTLPVFATCFALRFKNLIVAAALTWLALFLCPFFAFSALGLLAGCSGAGLPPVVLYLGVLLSNLAFALLACRFLRHSLSRRIYSF